MAEKMKNELESKNIRWRRDTEKKQNKLLRRNKMERKYDAPALKRTKKKEVKI